MESERHNYKGNNANKIVIIKKHTTNNTMQWVLFLFTLIQVPTSKTRSIMQGKIMIGEFSVFYAEFSS